MSGNFLESNLKRIFIHDPDLAAELRRSFQENPLEIRFSKAGLPVPVIEKKCLHSSFDPHLEAQRWMESLNLEPSENSLYIVNGIGFGYHLEELLKIISPERLIVVEKDISLAAHALALRPPETFPTGIQFIIGKSPAQVYQAIQLRQPEQTVLLEHPPSIRLHHGYFNTISGIFHAQKSTKRGGYKILVVSPLYGGSLPVASYVQRAFQRLGHRSQLLDNTAFYPGFRHLQTVTSNRQHRQQLQGLLNTLMAEAVTAHILECGADLVVFIAQAPVTVEVLKELKNVGVKTAFWFIEDYQLFKYWESLAPHFDRFFVIQKGEFMDRLQSIGCSDAHYLPLAADPEIHCPIMLSEVEREEWGSDLSHVGAGYYNRRQFFQGLMDLDFKIWGNDWEDCGSLSQIVQRGGERIETQDAVRIFNATRVNVNLHSSTYHEGVNPFGDYLNPRTFEIAAGGAFQLVDNRQYLSESFKVGEEIETFDNLGELREKAEYYLSHSRERRCLAEYGRRRVLSEHTYDQRMLELIGDIAGSYPEWTPKGGGLPTAEEIISQIDPQCELALVLDRFRGRGALTLEDLAKDVEKQAGTLNRTEAMILLLNEFRRWGLEKGVL
ncbi:MAG: glycosyltransferase [bacterium]